jgi:hypothetical protein
MKIVDFFLIIWGKLSELEPELEFLTNWSRSRSWSRKKWPSSATLCKGNNIENKLFLAL